jgi:hypothetical protein
MNRESSNSQHPLETLYQQYQFKSQLLSSHQQASSVKATEALAISELILFFGKQILALNDQDGLIHDINNQIAAENVRLAGVERDIADDFKIVDLICNDLFKISRAIEVCVNSLKWR